LPNLAIKGRRRWRKKRILVIEDEVLIALEIIANLESANAVAVGPCSSIDDALKAIEAIG
jgi:hypothetical protein